MVSHFFLDALAGTLLAGLTWAVVPRLTSVSRQARARAEPEADQEQEQEQGGRKSEESRAAA